MKLDHDFFQVSKLSEDQKKRSSPNWKTFFSRIQVKTKKKVFIKIGGLFSPNSGEDQIKKKCSSKVEDFLSPNSIEDQRSDADQSQISGGDTNVDHTQIIGGDTAKLSGGIYPHPPGFRHL